MSVLGKLLALVSALLLPIAVAGAWAERVVTDTEAYVDAVGPLADDPEVQDAVASRLAEVVRDRAPADLEQAGPRAVERVSRSVVSSDAFAGAWREANAEVHTQFVAAMGSGTDEELVLRLDPLVDEVLAALTRDLGLPAPPESDTALAVPVASSSDTARAREVYAITDALSPAAPLVWAATLVLALLPRGRRGALAVAAGTSVLTSLALWLAVGAGGPVVAEAADRRTFVLGAGVAELVYDGATGSLRAWALLAAGVSAVVLVVAVLARGAGRARG